MVTITPFQDEFCQKTYTIYSVNNCEPLNKNNIGGSITTSEVCPNCKERNIFRMYEPKEEYETLHFYISVYDCKCPKCGKEFEIIDEFEKEEE